MYNATTNGAMDDWMFSHASVPGSGTEAKLPLPAAGGHRPGINAAPTTACGGERP